MNEGEFKKRIGDFFLEYYKSRESHKLIPSETLKEWIEDAQKEFPDIDEMRFKVVGIDEWPPEDPMLTSDWNAFLKELGEWFKKWFGEAK